MLLRVGYIAHVQQRARTRPQPRSKRPFQGTRARAIAGTSASYRMYMYDLTWHVWFLDGLTGPARLGSKGTRPYATLLAPRGRPNSDSF